MAVITQLTKSAIDAKNRPDPLLDFKWYSAVIPLGLRSDYLESVDIPFNNIGLGENVYGGGGFTAFPTSHTISSFNATFYEDSLGTTLKWILSWKALVKDFKTGFYGLPSVYKRNWAISILNTMNEPVIDAVLKGCWPTSTSNFALNYTSNGRLIVTQEFAIDDTDYNFYK